MQALSKTTIATNILRIPLLRNIFFACMTIAVVFPAYSVFFVYPSFNELLIESTEDDAKLTATHLATTIIPEDNELITDALSDDLMTEIKKLERDFQLEKLQIFSEAGRIIYSTNPKDIGNINKEDYFRKIVAKGNVYTKIVRKDTASLEGRVVTSDVVETYVPLISNNRFNGAFEIYYDITTRKNKLDKLLSSTSSVLFSIASSLLIAMVIILFKASKAVIARSQAEEALRKTHNELERRVEERTVELSDANDELREQITERKWAEKKLQESKKKLHFLSSHLLTAQERERRRISLELHDELGQSLTVLKLQLRSIEKQLREDERALKEDCEEILHYVDQIIENGRRLSRDLSPSILEDLGLTAALRYLIDDFVKHSNIKIAPDMSDVDNLFSHDAQIVIYRIFQEAFSNIVKHATATHVSVVIKKKENSVNFLVEDDGTGFDMKRIEARAPTERTLGLVAMDERARMLGGRLEIDAQEGEGSRLNFSIPIDEGRRYS